jgi:hypothetical protein
MSDATSPLLPVPPEAPLLSGGGKPRDGLARGCSLLALLVALGAGGLSGWHYLQTLTAEPSAPLSEVLAVRQQLLELEKTVAAAAPASSMSPQPAPISSALPDAAVPDSAAVVDPQPADTKAVDHKPATSPVVEAADQASLAELRAGFAALQQKSGVIEELRQQVAQLKTELAVANTAISGMRGDVQHVTSTAQQAAVADTTTRAQMIAYVQLRSAAALAAPFVPEWQAFCDATKTIAPLNGECAKLEKAAQGGVATLPMLQARFAVLSGTAEQAVAMAEAKNWWERLKVSLDGIVKIRKIDEADVASTPRLIHDTAAALQRGNLPAALEKISALPPMAQDELREWVPDAAARVALDAALVRLGSGLGQAGALVAPVAAQPPAVPSPGILAPAAGGEAAQP